MTGRLNARCLNETFHRRSLRAIKLRKNVCWLYFVLYRDVCLAVVKINIIKQPGGVLIPSSDMDSDKLQKFKTGETYEIDMKLVRNPKFLRKVFAFFHYCYEYWDGGKVMEHGTPDAQFTRFRNDLTILAGYYHQTVRLNGEVRLEAKSLSYGSMGEEEFQKCYQAMISAAMKHLFKTDSDEEVYNKLAGFF